MKRVKINRADKKAERALKRPPLKWSMITVLILCWILPLSIIAYAMLYVTTSKINKQIERTIVTSADNAIKISEMQMNAAITASKNASYLPTIKESWQQYKKDRNKTTLYGNVIRFLEQHYRYDNNFLFTTLMFTERPNEPYYTSYSGSANNVAYRTNLYFMEKVHPLVMEIYPNLDTDVKLINVEGHIYMIRNMMDSEYNPFAVIVMELDKDSIFGSLESTWGYTDSQVYVDGELLVADVGNEIKADKENFRTNSRTSRLIQKDGEYYTYTVRKPDIHYIGYVISLDKQLIIDETAAIKYVCAFFVIFMIPLTIIVFIFFHKKVTKPIEGLIGAYHIINEGEFGYQIERAGNSQEFKYLTEAFNSMSEKLKHQFETIYSEELALKDARIMALQSQINPHFLNNTLEIINWEARINEDYKVSQMIENLSIMLEATMDRRHRRFVTLAEELSYVEAYLFIISQRLGERMHVEKNVDDTLFNVKVPRLIIQPIIENAVEHGIIGQPRACVSLNVFADKDKLVVEVRNTGRMSKEDEEKIEVLLSDDYEVGELSSASLGIRNVNRRIKIIYGEECGLTVKNDENNETVSRITVKMDTTTIKDNK
ncbi:MAG: histidine kinase [Clostridiales bacterium]|nr:histidine kinase [Clostridiales bacterium]